MPPKVNKSKLKGVKPPARKGRGSAASAAEAEVGPQVKVAKGEQPDSILDLNAPSTSAPPAAVSNKVGELS